MLRAIIFLSCLFGLACAAPVSPAFADYYQYTDSKGVVSMTNKLSAVPAQYRSSMKVIHEDAPSKKEKQPEGGSEEAAVPSQPAAAPALPVSRFEELAARFPWFKPLVYLGVVTALFLAITKVTALLPSRLLAKVIYLAFSLGVFAFIYTTYFGRVAQTTQKLKDDALATVKKSQERQQALPPGEPAASPQPK